MSFLHHYKVLILESHLDSFGHMNNANYLRIFEEARWDWITAGGMTYEKIHKTGLAPTILEINLRFYREIKLRALMTIETTVANRRGRLGTIVQTMKDSTGVVYCKAEFKFGIFDLKSRKLVLPSHDWLKVLGEVPEVG